MRSDTDGITEIETFSREHLLAWMADRNRDDTTCTITIQSVIFPDIKPSSLNNIIDWSNALQDSIGPQRDGGMDLPPDMPVITIQGRTVTVRFPEL